MEEEEEEGKNRTALVVHGIALPSPTDRQNMAAVTLEEASGEKPLKGC